MHLHQYSKKKQSQKNAPQNIPDSIHLINLYIEKNIMLLIYCKISPLIILKISNLKP